MNKIFIVDGNSFIYRAFHAIRFLSTSKGVPTNAIFGFTSMVTSLQNEYKPTHIAVVFDSRVPSFRKEIYPDYKANRPKMPDELALQIPYIKRIIEGFRIATFEIDGVEADDVIGKIVSDDKLSNSDIYIISSDKDLMQLVNDRVKLLDTMKKRIIGKDEVLERFGVMGSGITDILGLSGDSSDNIPGVHGIGEKRARELIIEFGSIENLLKNIQNVKSKSIRESLLKNQEIAILSKKLAELKMDFQLDLEIENLRVREPDKKNLSIIFKELEFSRFLPDLAPESKSIEKRFKIILTNEQLKEAIEKVENSSMLSIDLETTSLNPIEARIVGISISPCVDNEAFYIPLQHECPGAPDQLPLSETLNRLKPLIESLKIEKYGQNIKYDYSVLRMHGIVIKNITFDSMIASYLIDPSKRRHNLSAIAEDFLGYKMTEFETLFTGKDQNFKMVDIERAAKYSCDDAFVVTQVKDKMMAILESRNLIKLFNEIEMPLVPILAKMELRGVLIDRNLLQNLGNEYSKRIEVIEGAIYTLAKRDFNINSPKQLSEILFDELNLPVVRKTKTGRSTDSDVLESLAAKHPLPQKILEYRKLVKLKSTYIDTLPLLINKKTGRVHTSFNQTGTQTGRLSSSDPNLQNIPVRTADGKKIRESFMCENGKILLWADYSQIELRILAHISGDLALINAFNKGEDIHLITASEIFNKVPKNVSGEERSYAKTINFGIVYGMSAYGLSQELSIPVAMAEEYIRGYFSRYPGVEKYMKGIVEEAKKRGFITTIFGRMRHVPDINNPNRIIRENAERIAINTPIQGTAADLIKISMIRISNYLEQKDLKTGMILQVHDELLFESPEDEIDTVASEIKRIMENAYALKVPLIVNLSRGRNWV